MKLGVDPGLIEDPGEVLAIAVVTESDDSGAAMKKRQGAGEVVQNLGNLHGHRVCPTGHALRVVALAFGPGRSVDLLRKELDPLQQLAQLPSG